MVNEAFDMFREMQKLGIERDEVSLVSVISACVMSRALDIGRWVHAYIKEQMIHIDLELSTVLVNMHAKCGCIEKEKEIFNGMAVEVFSQMKETKAQPNHVTFVGILSACAHSGLASEVRNYWSSMLELGIKPLKEHYGGMVNLLCHGRGLQFCRDFADLTRSSNLENITCRLQEEWHEKMSHAKGINVALGYTSIKVDDFVHDFAMGNWSHPEAHEVKQVLRDVSVAIAYGLTKTKAPATVRIVKGRRVCADCHEWQRLSAKFMNRKLSPKSSGWWLERWVLLAVATRGTVGGLGLAETAVWMDLWRGGSTT
ncbi:unnamed protein product [Dovyalis caffra]|uniref:DYW domain-containing protein n=1 Tax=Dovyalis caffra TaxID=77055 RepID=A0AAV1S1W0_9ROSI|nr:unnamed protein product [Dovyalis caffra]